MKIFLVLIFMLFSMSGFSAVQMKLTLEKPQVKQGSLVSGTLIVDAENYPQFQLQKLQGQHFSEAVFFQDIGTLLRKEGEAIFSAPVQVLFTSNPAANQLEGVVGETTINLFLENIEVIPTEAAQELIFGKFEVPARSRYLFWASVGVIFILLSLLTWYLLNKWKKKQKRKQFLARLRSELEDAKSYDDVVNLWKKKKTYLDVFPHLEEPFQKLEGVLFRYQFKPHQTDEEQEKVVQAYLMFKASVSGGSDGV